MSHEVETMAYVGKTPWHGLGTPVSEGISPDEMLVAAGLDWQVQKLPLHTNIGPVPGHFALTRMDLGKTLGLVSNRYIPVQNSEAMDFFDSFLESAGLTMETAGSLYEGKVIWGMAKLPFQFALGGEDRVESYLVLTNDHAGERALTALLTTVRVVCQNTLNVALSNAGSVWRMSHTHRFDASARVDAAQTLGLAENQMNAFCVEAEALSQISIAPEKAEELLISWIGNPEDTDQPKSVNRVVRLFSGQAIGSGLASANGTAWGLLNAVTEFVDHGRTATRSGRSRRMRTSAVFGAGATLKRKAFKDLLQLRHVA
jgi:phage/plasmid-like protein (TIGR03299 family)